MLEFESSDHIPELLVVIDRCSDLMLCSVIWLVAWGLNWFFKIRIGEYGTRLFYISGFLRLDVIVLGLFKVYGLLLWRLLCLNVFGFFD